MSRDLVGKGSISMELDQQDVGNFKELLRKEFPSFSELDTFAVAVNESYAEDDMLLADRDIVAIIPPVSGG